MPNQSGSVYGLTLLSPIIGDPHAPVSHDLQLRLILGSMPRDHESPFAKVDSTHMCRLTVMNDVIYVGMPACEEHLQLQYLVFESNFDGDLETYLRRMAQQIPETVDAVWSHCLGYPGVINPDAFVAYMKKCQVTTTFYFADVNDKTVGQTLTALQTQSAVGAFVERNAGVHGAPLQQAFLKLMSDLREAPAPQPGSGREDANLCAVAGAGASSIHE
ncbi:MAG: hypothetical protein ABJC09_10635 [Terriglobia bacterium]